LLPCGAQELYLAASRRLNLGLSSVDVRIEQERNRYG